MDLEIRSGSNGARVKEFTVCALIDEDRILLRLATRGISEGKWCAPGGKLEEGETKEDCATRELREETGYSISRDRLFYNGNVDSRFPGDDTIYRIHVFSFKGDAGKQSQEREDGELKWFKLSSLPWDKMWKDYDLWLERVRKNEKFSISVNYESKNGDKIEKVKTNNRNKKKSAN
jgi:8-oxo-dGTP diphosphatase